MNDEKRYWLDDLNNVTKLYRGLWVVCVLLILLDLVVHRHEDFAFATVFGYHGFYGFFACVALVLAAKQLRKAIMRDEDYYDR